MTRFPFVFRFPDPGEGSDAGSVRWNLDRRRLLRGKWAAFGAENAERTSDFRKTLWPTRRRRIPREKRARLSCGRADFPEIRNLELYKRAGSNVLIYIK